MARDIASVADKDIREDIGGPDEVPPSEVPRSEGGPAAQDPGGPSTAETILAPVTAETSTEAGAVSDLPIDVDGPGPADTSILGSEAAPSVDTRPVGREPEPSVADEFVDTPVQDDPPPPAEPDASTVSLQAVEIEAAPPPAAESVAELERAAAPAPEECLDEATEASAPETEPWRAAIADALAEPPNTPLHSRPLPLDDGVPAGVELEVPAADTGEPEAEAPAAPSVVVSEPSFTTAAQDLFRPPAIEEEPHLITLGRRLDPSLRIPRPVPPDIAPAPEPAVAREAWWKTAPWDERLKTGLRYGAYIAGGYLALVLVLILLFRFVNPPGSMLMLTQFLTGTAIDRTWAPLESISRNLVRAVIVSEDGRFCEHSGIDTTAIKEAIERASRGTPRGASTISMQVTKNLFLWNAKSYVRKVIEIPLTLYMELLWPKWRILEVYLNIAEWGPGVFGAEAAARHHFGKSAMRLSEREAALLAAVLPNPVVRNAGSPSQRTSAKARVVQSRVKAYGAVASCVVPMAAAASSPAAEPAKAKTPQIIRKTPPRPAPRKKPPADDWAPTLNFGPN